MKEKILKEEKQNIIQSNLFDGFAYIELYVGNVHQAVHYYRTAYGFKPVAYLGMETGVRDRTSFLLQQKNIKLILTSPISKKSSIAEHLYRHNDSVKDIALKVNDIETAYHTLISKGAKPLQEPQKYYQGEKELYFARVRTFGDTVRAFGLDLKR